MLYQSAYFIDQEVRYVVDKLALITYIELLSDVLVLLELIFIRDGSFDVTANEAPLYSRSDIISFISSICTTVD